MRKQAASPNRLGALISRDDVKLAHLASHCDVDQSTLYRWRTGQTPIPDDKKFQLARFFGVSRTYLMGWDEEEAA